MKDGRWQEVERLYNSALERKPEQRAAYLHEACNDESLRKEVESLLACQSEAKGFIKSPALEAAAQDLARGQASQASAALAGRTLSHYKILEKLGEGGMGVVYKALDTRLNRPVALKVLPPDKVTDPERKRRFVKEARAASALNHPHIVTIHDIGQAEGVDFIAMEYMAGKTLDRQIPGKGMQLAKALDYAVQLADALAAAQSAGIIHRDLKPSNIMVSDSGQVKILDFGLAKLVERAELNGERNAPAETQESSLRTDEGMILGTAAYMSPEQAQGKKVDARSDIFSFGAVLYEMVSGRKAFQGDGMASTLAAIIRDEPKPLSDIVAGVPPELQRIIRRCLRKDPDRRWQNMSDLKVALQDLRDEGDTQPVGAPTLLPKRNRPWLFVAVITLPLLAAIGWLALKYIGPAAPSPRLVQLTSYPGNEVMPCFSPDGQQVAFAWNGEKQDNWDIYVKLVGESDAPLRLTTDAGGDYWPTWSPDGKRIAFQRLGANGENNIWVVSPLGGSEQKLMDLQIEGQMSWSPDGKWLAVARGRYDSKDGEVRGIFLVSVAGGELRRLSDPKAPARDWHPSFSPDGRQLVYASCAATASCDLVRQELDAGYFPKGNPLQITQQGLYIGGIAWSRDGRSLVYSGSLSWGYNPRLWRAWVDGAKQPERLELAGYNVSFPSIAPAGNRLAFARITGSYNIWRYQLSAVSEPFIASSLDDRDPQYSPDGRVIAFDSSRSGDVTEIWTANADGSHPVRLTKGIGHGQGSPRWSPDGRLIAFDSIGQDGLTHIYVVDAHGGWPRRITSGTSSDHVPSWSRDGNWIYYYSDRTGRNEVWRSPLSEGAAQQITENGGLMAVESTDGKSVFYIKSYFSPLFARSLSGGPERLLLDYVAGRSFAVFEDGIYYIGRPNADKQYPIQFYEFSTGMSRLLTNVEGPINQSMGVSPDRKTFLFSKWVKAGADLMLIDNFR